MLKGLVWAVLGFALLAAAGARAQAVVEQRGALSVFVTDDHCDPLPGATVFVCDRGASAFVFQTDARGVAVIPVLTGGPFECRVALAGFVTQRVTGVRLDHAADANCTVALPFTPYTCTIGMLPPEVGTECEESASLGGRP